MNWGSVASGVCWWELEDRNAVARQPIDVPLSDTIADWSCWLWTAVEKPCCHWSNWRTLICEDVCWLWCIATPIPKCLHGETVNAITGSCCLCCLKSRIVVVSQQLIVKLSDCTEVWIDLSGRSQRRQIDCILAKPSSYWEYFAVISWPKSWCEGSNDCGWYIRPWEFKGHRSVEPVLNIPGNFHRRVDTNLSQTLT